MAGRGAGWAVVQAGRRPGSQTRVSTRRDLRDQTEPVKTGRGASCPLSKKTDSHAVRNGEKLSVGTDVASRCAFASAATGGRPEGAGGPGVAAGAGGGRGCSGAHGETRLESVSKAGVYWTSRCAHCEERRRRGSRRLFGALRPRVGRCRCRQPVGVNVRTRVWNGRGVCGAGGVFTGGGVWVQDMCDPKKEAGHTSRCVGALGDVLRERRRR